MASCLDLWPLWLLSIICSASDGNIEPWTTNSTGEYYLFHSRPDDLTIRNLTCNAANCIVQCNEEESCQKFNIHATDTQHLDLQCDFPKQKELRPGSCWRANIITQNVHDIAIYCTNENCAESKFYIHTQQGGASQLIFNGDWSGKFASIFASDSNSDLLTVCNDTESCSDIRVHCPSTHECHIHCNGTKACWNAHIFVPSAAENKFNFDALHLDCTYSDTSCDSVHIHCSDGTENKLWFDYIDAEWRCFDKHSKCCPYAATQQTSVQDVQCEENTECVIDCNDDAVHCHWATIDASKAHSLTLKCHQPYQCKLSNVICPSSTQLDNAQSCKIECEGKEACRFMQVTASKGSSDSNTGAFGVECKARSSCQDMAVQLTVSGRVRIECVDEWACANAKFAIDGVVVGGAEEEEEEQESHMLEMRCNGRYSCEGVEMQCPFGTADSCLMHCSDADSSCNGVHVFAPPAGYQYGYLQIECPVKARAVLKPCNFITVSCLQDETSTVIKYSKEQRTCHNDECCPWKSEANVKPRASSSSESAYAVIATIVCCLGGMFVLTTTCNVYN